MSKIKLEADKIKGRYVDIEGKKCIVIPFKPSYMDVFLRKDGSTGITINLQSWELKEPKANENGFTNTAFLKPDLKKEDYSALTEEQRKQIPIVGGISEYKAAAPEPEQITANLPEQQEENDDLPF